MKLGSCEIPWGAEWKQSIQVNIETLIHVWIIIELLLSDKTQHKCPQMFLNALDLTINQ